MVILLVTLNVRLVSGVADPAAQRNVMELSPNNGQDGTDRGHPYGGKWIFSFL